MNLPRRKHINMPNQSKRKHNKLEGGGEGEPCSTPPPSKTPSAPSSFASFLDYQFSLVANQPQSHAQFSKRLPFGFSLPVVDHDIRAIINAYKDEPGNPMYAFKHFLFSVTEPLFRVKPAGVSELEGMERADRERLWPQLVHGFKDLSHRLLIQDEVIVSDAQRLRITKSNVKMLQRHVQAETLPQIHRMKQREQMLHRRLSRLMRTVEILEGKGCRIPLTKGEAELANKLATITRQLKGSEADLSNRVQHLLMVSRVQTNSMGFGGSVYNPGSIIIYEQSLADLQEVLQRQMEAIARLGSVLKQDTRNLEIMIAGSSV